MPLLEVDGLVKSFKRRRGVAGVSFHINEGEIVGLLGPNGAGKTTSFRMTCGLLEPDEGTVTLQSKDVTDWPMHRRAKVGGMGYLAQKPSIFQKLSVEKNLLLMLELVGIKGKAAKLRCTELLEQFKIPHIRKTKSAKVSGGERRRLEIARCLISDPRVIMLDEPFAGVDPIRVQEIRSILLALRDDEGISILITDHNAEAILQTVDRCYVINEGQVLYHGTPEEVKQHPEVRQKYLGDMDDIVSTRPISRSA